MIPVFKAKGNKPCVIVPPFPRYLFSRCCNDESHCTNASEENYAEQLLSGFVQLRTDLIRQLVQSGLTEFKVLDSCCTTSCATTANIPERIESLRKTTWMNGIHFNKEGNIHLVNRAISCLKGLITSPKKKTRKGTFFWRGFQSLNGSTLPRTLLEWWLATGGRPPMGSTWAASEGARGGYHPYRRW